jgi:hypothetical protein
MRNTKNSPVSVANHLPAAGGMVGSANVVTGSNFRARQNSKSGDRDRENFVPVTIFASVHTSATGCSRKSASGHTSALVQTVERTLD